MSTNGLATREQVTTIAPPLVTPDQMTLITKTVAQGATPDELKLYLYDCQRQGVHPLDRMLHFTKRGGKYTPVTSIDLMRTRAADTGEYAGSDDATYEWEMQPSLAPDYSKPPRSASVTVWRMVQGQRCPFKATARWSEYYPGDQAGTMWRKMPHTMLGKCAEALALRKGFPKQLAGLYAREEMDQAQDAAPLVTAPKPAHVPQGQDVIDTRTGEVVEVPAGALTIASCSAKSGKKAGEVTFSDGVTATVWASDGRLFDLCVELCQKGTPVKPNLLPGKGTYGPTLKSVQLMDAEQDQRPAHDWTQDVPEDAPF